uniref:Uncharacterized protein n=1 Tax=Strongyloides papillosus TaxID=174720 RepID=A0A0N5BMS1_STREA
MKNDNILQKHAKNVNSHRIQCIDSVELEIINGSWKLHVIGLISLIMINIISILFFYTILQRVVQKSGAGRSGSDTQKNLESAPERTQIRTGYIHKW